ncbi:hypothetical protein [Candidatus Viadribacter manganicus]|uniref:Uncharacterized protein n=1 Tax=Candidatus Viadribacter manganicus TaxID=1759059 RepID=A0A1B1AHI4_9PROT|nr:hypothetical protein [Candidatus Viadribacter manganicus]ANP46024.1 hypothetical protein ATE48_08875 [Candidatus Viadribacter manganicus]
MIEKAQPPQITIDESYACRSGTAHKLEELWGLSVDRRAQVLYDSGAHPDNDEMRALFLSCEAVLWLGPLLVAAIETGRTPNAYFYTGEGRRDVSVWGEAGCPVPLPKRAPPRRPSKRALERAMQEFDRKHGLFKLLRCGCLERCPGLQWHAQIEAAEEARERALREEHAAWDAARENALADARRDFADELARVTLNQPVNVDPDTAGEFACLLAPDDDP